MSYIWTIGTLPETIIKAVTKSVAHIPRRIVRRLGEAFFELIKTKIILNGDELARAYTSNLSIIYASPYEGKKRGTVMDGDDGNSLQTQVQPEQVETNTALSMIRRCL